MARGQLRIYLGAAPGVGKTVAMLSEGARRAARGTDVAVALCETYGRPHTEQMLSGLEVIPRKSVLYRGATFHELDLDAVLTRRPEVALVDELAHTNAPGSRHEKRWQDIETLLDAGIDVISTVNIQHLESLNDAVESITGIVQQETVPDQVVRAADQIELVDMSPEALRRRMAHGNVYKAEKVDAALSNYFRVGNLGALRELALLWLADRVDEALARYRADHDISGAWPARERVVVALSGGPEGAPLLRRAARIASRGAGGELHAVYVARGDGLSGPSVPEVARLRTLCEEVGGTFHTVGGDDPARAVLDFARALNASQIVVGASRRTAWRRGLRNGTSEAIIAEAGEIDVLVVTHPYTGGQRRRTTRGALPGTRIALGSVLAVAGPIVLTLLLTALPMNVGLPLIVLVYLLVTVMVALLGGMWPALGAAVVSSLLINWFFAPPLYTLTIDNPENAAAILVFIAIAAAVSIVVHRSARRAAAALEAQQESSALAELTHTLLGTTDQMSMLLNRALDMFGAQQAVIVRRATREAAETIIDATSPDDNQPNPDSAVTRESVDDAHDLVLWGPVLPADRQRLLAAFAAHAGAILHRRQLQTSASEADALARDSRARTALLSAVSHDLRTPLAAVKAAIGSLRSTEVEFSAEDRAELEAIIEESADRLEALIDNLLDMSRLQAGALVVHPRPTDLGEVLPSAIRTLSEPERVDWRLSPDARQLYVDPGLLERVLVNVMENALRHAPHDTPVHVASSRLGEIAEIRIVDQGPGVAPGQRDRIFLPFQRLGDVPAGTGVGLGLAVARGLTEAMDGSIEAEDTPGGGLTIVVGVPTSARQEAIHE